jgi:transaldolase
MNSLDKLTEQGVSIWLDDLSRDRINSGSLLSLIKESHVVGVTTNPSIFSSAVHGSDVYTEQIQELKRKGFSTSQIVTELTTKDVADACDLFMDVYRKTAGQDGRVSIEVEPDLAYDTADTIDRAIFLWQKVNRPNLLIKVPATIEGLPAIEELTARGLSVNVTLIFSAERYREVLDAYIRGLERRRGSGKQLSNIHSVASFFVSRIDTAIDKELPGDSPIKGKIAIANARLAYEIFLQTVSSARWQNLAAAGANLQRPLWASTGVKDKNYNPTRYVVELVAPHCVNTMPEGTLDAVRSQGVITGDTITSSFDESRKNFTHLEEAGIDFSRIVAALEDDGVKKFSDAWNELLSKVDSIHS